MTKQASLLLQGQETAVSAFCKEHGGTDSNFGEIILVEPTRRSELSVHIIEDVAGRSTNGHSQDVLLLIPSTWKVPLYRLSS